MNRWACFIRKRLSCVRNYTVLAPRKALSLKYWKICAQSQLEKLIFIQNLKVGGCCVFGAAHRQRYGPLLLLLSVFLVFHSAYQFCDFNFIHIFNNHLLISSSSLFTTCAIFHFSSGYTKNTPLWWNLPLIIGGTNLPDLNPEISLVFCCRSTGDPGYHNITRKPGDCFSKTWNWRKPDSLSIPICLNVPL